MRDDLDTSSGWTCIKDTTRKHRSALIFSAILAIVGAMLGLAPYIIVYRIATELFLASAPDRTLLFSLALCAAVAIIAKVAFKALANAVSHRAAYRILADLRIALAERLARMPLGRVRARTTGHLRTVLQDDVEQLELGLSHAIPDIAAAVSVPIASIIVMLVMGWQVGVAALLAVVVAVLLIVWGVSRASGLAMQESEIKANLSTSVISYLRGMRVLRDFLPNHQSYAPLEAALTATANLEDRKESRGKWQAVASTSLTTNLLVIILPVALWCSAQGIITPAALVFFLLVGAGFAQPLFGLLISLAVLQYQVEAGLKNIAEILSEPDLPTPAEPRHPIGYNLQLRNVCYRYTLDGPNVLDRITLDLPENSSLAIVGPSGGGKSTLLGLLARFHDASDGTVRLGGVDLRDMSPVELMRQVAYVQQDEYLFHDTLLENIRVARPGATDDEVIAAAERARVTSFAEELSEGWHTVLPAGGGQLSGGQRQRISIARALLKGARVILLDEVTAFLDAESEAAVVAALDELRASATMVTVSHRLGTVTGYDRIAYLAEGRIVACGSHDGLLSNCSDYADLWSDYLDAQGWQVTADPDPQSAPAGPERDADQNISAAQAPEPPATPRVRGLGQMHPLRQWFALLGHQRRDLGRVGIWLILLDGMLTSAPIIVLVLALLDTFAGTLTAAGWCGYGAWLAGIYLARWLIGVATASYWWPRANQSLLQLRRSVLRHLRRIPMGEYDRLDVGRLATLVVSDVPLVDFINLPAKAIIGLLQPVIAAVVLFLLDWQIALAALIGVPVFWLLLFVSDRVEKRVLSQVLYSRAQASSDLLEFVRGTAVIRANPDTPHARRYRDSVEHLRRHSVAMAVRTSPLTAVASAVLEFGFAVLVWAVCVRHLDGGIPESIALLSLVVSLTLYRPYQELLELASYRHLQSRIADHIGAIWDIEPLPEGGRDRLDAGTTGVPVELRNVTFGYREGQRVLTGANMVAEPNAVTALVGPSGAGKSTVANLVARAWDVDSGTVLLAGTDVRELSSSCLANQVTTVYQDVFLFPSTMRENLAMGTQASDDELWQALRLAQADEFAAAMPGGLDARIYEGGSNLSGGQRQRLSIARALVKDAPVLLLDEAVASVDPGTEVRIQRALSHLVAGRTVLVIAHRLNTVSACDAIVVLNREGIESSGTHRELLEVSPTYQRLWRAHEQASAARSSD